MSKYVWLVDTIYKARRITFQNINRLWCENVDMSGGEDLPVRTFNNWRYAIQDMFGLFIENERCGSYRYYIDNEEDIKNNGLRSWLFNTFSVGNTLAGCQNIKDRIVLEYVPSGQVYLQSIIEAMKGDRVINITYKSFWSEVEKNYDVEPLCLKLFRQRWYMVGKLHNEDLDPWIYALDRIKYLEKKDETFTMPKNWNAESYFDGSFGIFPNPMGEKEIVKLKVATTQANYIRALKLHHSQQEVERNDEYSIFTYHIRATYDFIQELLWNAEFVEVLEPQWLRKEMATKTEKMYNLYKDKQ